MEKITNVMSDKVKTIIGVLLFIIFISVVGIWFYNFLGLSDVNMYDNENKYIDASLGDVDGNYQESYLMKTKSESLMLTLGKWFSSIYGIFSVIFIGVFLLTFLVGQKDSVMSFFKSLFDRD